MSHSISEVGQILKDHCEQSNKAYQNSVVGIEEESRNIITKQVQIATEIIHNHNYNVPQYSGFVENIISAVDFVDNELKRDGKEYMCLYLYVWMYEYMCVCVSVCVHAHACVHIIHIQYEYSIIITFLGIYGGGSFNQALKSHWFNPIDSDAHSAQNVYVLSHT